MNELTLFLGRFHPLLVHFPIVLLVLAGVCDLCAWWGRRTNGAGVLIAPSRPALASLGDSTGSVLSLGALSAVAAAGAGYLLGGSGGYGGATFVWHERLGVAVAIGAALTWCGWILARRSRRPELATVVYRTLLVTTLIVIALAGHLGATLTHGEGYLTEHAPAPIRGWLARGARRARRRISGGTSRSGDRLFDCCATNPGQALRSAAMVLRAPRASSGSTRSRASARVERMDR